MPDDLPVIRRPRDAPTRCPASRRIPSTSVRYSSPWLLSVRTLPSASASSRPSKANTPELISRIARCVLGRVLVLDDRGDRAARLVPHDPAVTGGVRHLGGQHGHGVAVGGVGRGERAAASRRSAAGCPRRRRPRCRRRRPAAAPPDPSGRRGPVPFCSCCTAVRTPGVDLGQMRGAPAPGRARRPRRGARAPAHGRRRRTCPTSERPQISCRTFGVADFIRVPSPAARTMMAASPPEEHGGRLALTVNPSASGGGQPQDTGAFLGGNEGGS